jgi:hypothetical protein
MMHNALAQYGCISILGCVFSCGHLPAQIVEDPPDFDLRVEAPASVVAEPLSVVEFQAAVVLESRAAASSGKYGAQGWALSLLATGGAEIVEATTTGTAAEKVPVGFFRDGFQITELTSGPDNEGAISAVALAFHVVASLPRNGKEKLLGLTVKGTVPSATESCRRVTLEFRDGLKGSGMPVRNNITFLGQTYRDDGSSQDSDLDREEPGEIFLCPPEVPFFRGDCNQDKSMDISDAIWALSFLFLGGKKPGCITACDANDDGFLDITDPIYTLNHLFLGGRSPPPPRDECGVDPTPGTLSCFSRGC